jgi:hypothetical protein
MRVEHGMKGSCASTAEDPTGYDLQCPFMIGCEWMFTPEVLDDTHEVCLSEGDWVHILEQRIIQLDALLGQS